MGAGRMFGNFSGNSTTATAGNLEFKTMVKDEVLKTFGPLSETRGAPGAPLSVDNVKSIILENQKKIDLIYRLDAAFMGARTNIYKDWLTNNQKVLNQVDDRVKFSMEMWAKYNMAHTLSPVAISKSSGYTLSNPNASAKIYYTTNGSDPMGPDGVVSTSAIEYKAGTVLPIGLALTVRPFVTNNWGPKTTAK
jgi:hypothetical protein